MGSIIYSKQAQNITEQILLLQKRGVFINNLTFAQQVLETVS